MSVKEYKKVKGLEKESLRDNMSNLEIVLNMFAEVTTTEISKKEKPSTFKENKIVARRGGKVAKSAKIEYEKEVKSMKEFLRYERIDRKDITEEQFKQVLKVERSEGEENCYSEEVMREIFIEDQKDDNFVCSYRDEIVAYISYNPKSQRRKGSIYIINLVVSPEHRKKGIAQNLIYTACKYYQSKGNCLPMSLQVDKDNIPAINLYKKVGFEIKEPICEADEDDEQYIMEADISDLIRIIEKISNKNTNR